MPDREDFYYYNQEGAKVMVPKDKLHTIPEHLIIGPGLDAIENELKSY